MKTNSIKQNNNLLSLRHLQNLFDMPKHYSLWNRLSAVLDPEMASLLHTHTNLIKKYMLIDAKYSKLFDNKTFMSYREAKSFLQDSQEQLEEELSDVLQSQNKNKNQKLNQIKKIEKDYWSYRQKETRIKSSEEKDNNILIGNEKDLIEQLQSISNELQKVEKTIEDLKETQIIYSDREIYRYIEYRIKQKDPLLHPMNPPSIFSADRWKLALNTPAEHGISGKLLVIISPQYASTVENYIIHQSLCATPLKKHQYYINYKKERLADSQKRFAWEEEKSMQFAELYYVIREDQLHDWFTHDPSMYNLMKKTLEKDHQQLMQSLYERMQNNTEHINIQQQEIKSLENAKQEYHNKFIEDASQKLQTAHQRNVIGVIIGSLVLISSAIVAISLRKKIRKMFTNTNTPAIQQDGKGRTQHTSTEATIDIHNTVSNAENLAENTNNNLNSNKENLGGNTQGNSTLNAPCSSTLQSPTATATTLPNAHIS